MSELELHGFGPSVYAWIVRLTLREKGLSFTWREVDPFSALPPGYLALHPFGRVPVLVHDGFTLYETAAITRYLDEGFPGPSLQPADARARARMQQVIAIVDSYAYWPLVRQVFSHGAYLPRLGRQPDPAQYQAGLEAAPRVLAALEALAAGEPGDPVGDALLGGATSLADLHLAPMIAYFAATGDGAALLAGHRRLDGWFRAFARRPAFAATHPDAAS